MRRTLYLLGIVALSVIALGLMFTDPYLHDLRTLAASTWVVSDRALFAESAEAIKIATAYGMVSVLDDYSTWHDRVADTLIRREARGHYGGFGIEIVRFDDTTLVWQVFPQSPAQRAGLRMGDRLLTADTFSLVGLPLDSVHMLLASIPGDLVDLGLYRPAEDTILVLPSRRARIEVSTIRVPARRDHVAYIVIESFNAHTSEALGSALDSLTADGVEKFIIDLRSNPGGLLHTAIECAELFLPQDGQIVSVTGVRPREVFDGHMGPYPREPVVLLVDGRSASGSELMAGCLQDWDRAVLVGAPTFGKGFVQNLYGLIDESSLRLTIGTYRTPSGRTFYRPDSTRVTDTSTYQSLIHGRTLTGGGQIFPDVMADEPDCPNHLWRTFNGRGLFDFACDLLGDDTLPAFDADLAAQFWASDHDEHQSSLASELEEILDESDRSAAWARRIRSLAAAERVFDGEAAADCILLVLARHLTRGGLLVPILEEPLITTDPALAEAIRILGTPGVYDGILTGSRPVATDPQQALHP